MISAQLFSLFINKALRPEPDITGAVDHRTRVTRAPHGWRQDVGVGRMRDANYLHAQAELCEIARQISDQATAEDLRAEAARIKLKLLPSKRRNNRSHKADRDVLWLI
jgi:hypothetical protein